MKQIISSYTFDKTARTITFTDFSSISLSRVLLITNVTANVIIYQFNSPVLGGSVAGNVLTLTYDTSAMDSSDKLQILYDCALGDPQYDAGLALHGRYQATPPTVSDGQYQTIQLDSNGNVKTNMAVKLDTVNDAISSYEKGWTPVNLTASGQVLSGAGTIKGYHVNSTSAGTLRLADNTVAGSGYIGGVITPVAGFHQYPATVTTGAYATLTGTIDVTFFVRVGSQA